MTTVSYGERGVPADRRHGCKVNAIATATRSGGRMAIAWRRAVNYLVPVGYKDEAGFHYGEPPIAGGGSRLDQEAA